MCNYSAHRRETCYYTLTSTLHVPSTEEVQTPTLDSLVASGIELDRAYAYKCCSPTRRSVSPLPCRLLSQQLIPLPPAAPSSLAATRTTSTP